VKRMAATGGVESEKRREEFLREVALLKELSNPHIVQFQASKVCDYQLLVGFQCLCTRCAPLSMCTLRRAPESKGIVVSLRSVIAAEALGTRSCRHGLWNAFWFVCIPICLLTAFLAAQRATALSANKRPLSISCGVCLPGCLRSWRRVAAGNRVHGRFGRMDRQSAWQVQIDGSLQ
jgi:hypothetical protein